MSKKNRDHGHDDETDLEDDEETERDEDDEDDEEDAHPAPAAKSRGRARSSDAHAGHSHDGHGGHDAHDEHDEDDEDGAEDLDDPYWWTPHAVMAVLVILGVLGFFGVFNKALGGIAAKPAGGSAVATTTHGGTQAASPKPAAPNAAPGAQREEFGAKHLLVQYKGAMRAAPSVTRTEEEAKARAQEALKKAKAGAKFEDLVKEYSDEPGAAQRGGDLGKFRKGQMVPAFQEAVEKLKVGEISDLVKTQFGYHVIQRTQ
jgi:parvulin-like peptidyl-prolyl isomerase